ncbi:MAG: hypothetical protein U0353_09885 [Sandaracinus sp.]
MTEDDSTLREAARALREATDAPSPEAAATRARLLAAHERDRRSLLGSARATQWLAAAAVFAVLFVAPSAWALYTGRAQRWIEAIVGPARLETVAPTAPPGPPSTRPRHTPSIDTTTVEPPIEPTPIEPTPIEPTPIEPTPIEGLPVARDEVEEPEARPSVPASVAPIDDTSERDERLSYQRAHALEFEAHDHDAAITAYDRYLARYPRGHFATEARYTRAVSLAHVGRTGEAIQALTPFAHGAHGGYRQDEAAELVRALEASERP